MTHEYEYLGEIEASLIIRLGCSERRLVPEDPTTERPGTHVVGPGLARPMALEIALLPLGIPVLRVIAHSRGAKMSGLDLLRTVIKHRHILLRLLGGALDHDPHMALLDLL